MKKILILTTFLLFSFSFLFASYDSDITNGYNEYKAGNYGASLVYYKRAYKVHPTKKIHDVIIYIENKLQNPENERTRRYSDGIYWAPQNRIITVNPLGLAFGYLNAHYEMTMGRFNGLGFDGAMNFYGGSGWSGLGLTVGADFNWYFQRHALNGWFAGPLAALSLVSFSYKYTTFDPVTLQTTTVTDSATGFGLEIGGHGGYRWIWDNGFTVDVEAGLAETIGGVTLNGISGPFGGFGLLVGCDLGYAF